MGYGIVKIKNCVYGGGIKKGNKVVIKLLGFWICGDDMWRFLRFMV